MITDVMLSQREIWTDGTGKVHVIREMEDEQLATVHGWLLRNASQIRNTILLQAHYDQVIATGTTADYTVSPHMWMENRPLLQAIRKEINLRRGIVTCVAVK